MEVHVGEREEKREGGGGSKAMGGGESRKGVERRGKE